MIDSLAASDTCEDLQVVWEDGQQTTFPAAFLRQEAKDAWTIRERLDKGAVGVLPGIRITGLYQVGPQGVNVHFSDGHDKAIYPFVYLRELSNRFDK